jgi:uncharacterized membrane protein YdbT with pleckstrin-like domain
VEELPESAKLARRILKVILLPVVVLAVVVRFTVVPAIYWIDVVFIVLFVIAAVLAVVGRVFTAKKDSTTSS